MMAKAFTSLLPKEVERMKERKRQELDRAVLQAAERFYYHQLTDEKDGMEYLLLKAVRARREAPHDRG